MNIFNESIHSCFVFDTKQHAEDLTTTIAAYMQLNGFCLILVLFRMMKMLDFQPRLGLVTKTIRHALSDLLHFFMILGLILTIYVVMSFYLFGAAIESFSTVTNAFNANFLLLLGEVEMLDAITNETPAMGFIFFYSFLMIVFFVLLNILLAILVEAYMKALSF